MRLCSQKAWLLFRTLLVGLFAESSIGGVRGAFYGDGGSLIACQLLGVGITVCWSGVMSLLLIKVMLKYCDVDVSVEVEECGLDLTQVVSLVPVRWWQDLLYGLRQAHTAWLQVRVSTNLLVQRHLA